MAAPDELHCFDGHNTLNALNKTVPKIYSIPKWAYPKYLAHRLFGPNCG